MKFCVIFSLLIINLIKFSGTQNAPKREITARVSKLSSSQAIKFPTDFEDEAVSYLWDKYKNFS